MLGLAILSFPDGEPKQTYDASTLLDEIQDFANALDLYEPDFRSLDAPSDAKIAALYGNASDLFKKHSEYSSKRHPYRRIVESLEIKDDWDALEQHSSELMAHLRQMKRDKGTINQQNVWESLIKTGTTLRDIKDILREKSEADEQI